MKSIINRKAGFHYQILEEYEAGIVLLGKEVKSIKNNRMDISSAYVSVSNDEVFLNNASIPLYEHAAKDEDYDPSRQRKLLLKKSEIFSLKGKTAQKGLTLIPTKVYTKRGRVKILVALAKGKSKIDKRETIKKRDALRRIQSRMKER